MSNFDNHIVGIFQDDLETVKEFLKIAINTIIFNRWLTNKNYVCEKSAIKDISYMKIEDASVEKDIENILYNLSYYSTSCQKFQINLEFYTKNICKSIKEIYCKNIYAGVKNLHKSIQNDIVKFAKNECQDFLELDFINLIKTNFKID